MSQSRIERIPAEYTDAVHAYILSMLDDPALEMGIRERKRKEYNEYLAAHRPINVKQYKRKGMPPVQSTQKLAQYGPGGFNELLRIADLSFQDYFVKIRGEADQFPVLTEDELWLRDVCDRMDDVTLDKVRAIATEMSPEFWSSQEAETFTPTLRVTTLISMQIPRSERNGKLPPKVNTETITKAVCDRHRYTTVDMEDLLVVSNAFHVSIHWLMMGDDSVSATARNPRTERVLNAYGFMSEATRRTFLKAVKYIDTMQNMWAGGESCE